MALPSPVVVFGSSPSAFGGGAGIAGRVVLETGAPVPVYGIVLTKTADGHFGDQPVPVRDADGRFGFEKVVAGTWNVIVAGPEIARQVVTGVQLVDGRVTDMGLIKVHQGLRITGRVLDGNSHGIAGATLSAEAKGIRFVIGDGPDPGDALAPTAKTDASGHYVLRGISPGTGSIEANRGDLDHVLRHAVPAHDATIDFVFDATGGIDGEVEGLDHGQVSARMGTDHRTANIGRDGTFAFERMQPGDYLVRERMVSRPGGRSDALATVIRTPRLLRSRRWRSARTVARRSARWPRASAAAGAATLPPSTFARRPRRSSRRSPRRSPRPSSRHHRRHRGRRT